MKLRTTTMAACAAILTLAASGCAGAEGDGAKAATNDQGFPETLVLGAVPAEESGSLEASFDPVIKGVEAETGSTVDVIQASDYAGVIEGLIAGNVDIAFLGSFGYVIATENGAEITPLGAVTSAKGVDAGYYSLGITQGDNDEVNALADFAGKDICFVDPGSTSGFLYPTYGLIEEGIIEDGAEQALKKGLNPVFAGGHDASALAIKNGDCEAGFAMQPMVEQTLVETGDLKEGDLKEVWKSPMISGSVFVVRDGLGEEAVAELIDIFTTKINADYLLEQGLCEGDCLISDEDAWGVVPADDSDYDGVREVCAITKSEACDG